MSDFNAFEQLYNRQKRWQDSLFKDLFGEDYQKSRLTKDKIVDENLYNAIEEIIEARRSINVRKYWNPGKRDLPMYKQQRDECAEEIIDVFHFLMTALIYLGFDFDDIQAILRAKIDYNDTREDHVRG